MMYLSSTHICATAVDVDHVCKGHGHTVDEDQHQEDHPEDALLHVVAREYVPRVE